jgi:hypothetical protein
MGSHLRTIEIVRVNLCLPRFEAKIADGDFPGLKELIVREVGDRVAETRWDHYDFARMSRVICEHLPDLERLKWSQQNYHHRLCDLRPFGSFKSLRRLTNLIMDQGLSTSDLMEDNLEDDSWGQPIHLLNAHDMLPASLESLSITKRNVYFVEVMYQKYVEDPSQYPAVMEVIVAIAATLNLKVFEVSFEMDDADGQVFEICKPIRMFLPIMVEALNNLGIRMQVWRQKSRFDEKLLYEPGFVVVGPHWADVDEKYRANDYNWEE